MSSNEQQSTSTFDEERNQFATFEHFSTLAIHAGYNPEDHKSFSCPVVTPISLSTTFLQKGPGEDFGFDYSRAGNPTRQSLETCLAKLENAEYGTVYSSGLAATTSITQMLKSGDHILISDDVYGGTNRFFRTIVSKFNVEHTLVDLNNLDEVKKQFLPGKTRMVWIETPTNPLMKVVDIEAVVKLSKSLDSEVLVVVDNTFMSSYFQRPLSMGADIVMHSLTKYMNGHSDVVMGAVMTSNKTVHESLQFIQKSVGAVPGPFDCFLVLRGLRTLAVRMRKHMLNGLAVARYLEAHPMVERVIHPGLKSHPQYEVAQRQMKGFSGMVSVVLAGPPSVATSFLKNLKVFSLAESLGGFESLAEIPSLMTHGSVPAEHRRVLGISDNLVRLSVGLEDVEDLIEDVAQALKNAAE